MSLESRIAALEERHGDKWFIRASKRLDESEDEAIDRAIKARGLERADVACVHLWFEVPPPPPYEAGEEATLRWVRDYPFFKSIDLLPHDGIENLRGYESITAVLRRMDAGGSQP